MANVAMKGLSEMMRQQTVEMAAMRTAQNAARKVAGEAAEKAVGKMAGDVAQFGSVARQTVVEAAVEAPKEGFWGKIKGFFNGIPESDYTHATPDAAKALAHAQTSLGDLSAFNGQKFKLDGKLSIAAKEKVSAEMPATLVLDTGLARIDLLERADVGLKTPSVYLFDKFNVGAKEKVSAFVTIQEGALLLDGVKFASGLFKKP